MVIDALLVNGTGVLSCWRSCDKGAEDVCCIVDRELPKEIIGVPNKLMINKTTILFLNTIHL